MTAQRAAPPQKEVAPGVESGATESVAVVDLQLGTSMTAATDSRKRAHLQTAIYRHAREILDLLGPRCDRCGRPLFADESIRRGIGPVCRRAVSE